MSQFKQTWQKNVSWHKTTRSKIRTHSLVSGLALLTFTSPPLRIESRLRAVWQVEIIRHIRTLVQNHAAMLWSLQHQNHENHNTMTRNSFTTGLTLFFHANWCILGKNKKVMGGSDMTGKTKKQATELDRPAFCIWPDRVERLLCVWFHSSESHQSHTGRNTSESRTHNCPPLKKHKSNFKNICESLSVDGQKSVSPRVKNPGAQRNMLSTTSLK